MQLPKLLLAPMAGVTDAPYREICLRHGAAFTYTEMISAASIVYRSSPRKVDELLETAAGEEQIGVQLFGSDPELFCAAATEVMKRLGDKVALIDVNMGCPVAKVVRKGEGSALMKDPERAARIVDALVNTVKVPVTVKFRAGWDFQKLNAVEFGQRLESAGAAALCLHPRTRAQMYAGTSDWSQIASLKRHVGVPVIGSGDLKTPSDVLDMFETTACDSVMVARGALGNPWVFSRAAAIMAGKEAPGEATPHEKLAAFREHACAEASFYGNERAARRMRKHLMWYAHGLPKAVALRQQANATETFGELMGVADSYEREYERRVS